MFSFCSITLPGHFQGRRGSIGPMNSDNPYKHMRPSGLSRSARSAQAKAIRAGKTEWEREKRARLERFLADAAATVDEFNSKLATGTRYDDLMSSPLLRAAIISKNYWMHVLCPGCDSIKAIDLRVVPRSPDEALVAIAHKLRCQNCDRKAPAPTITKLSKFHDV
jgi:hypothetical protein